MSTNPTTLRTLGSYWVSQKGTNLGVVGNAAHRRGYHLGKDRLTGPDYSTTGIRDHAGLSNAASAIDLGPLAGSLPKLRKFSVWLVRRCQADAPYTSDIREVIYSPDGKKVLRYDRLRGVKSVPRTGEADNSHLTHTHISFFRDSQARDKVRLFRPYFTVPVTYKVVAGDNLTKIATKLKVKGGWQALAKLNDIESPYIIRPGQVLRLPA